MLNDVIFITRKAPKSEAFVVGGNFIPSRIADTCDIEGEIYRFRHNGCEPLECAAGDIVYYSNDRGEGPYLMKLDPAVLCSPRLHIIVHFGDYWIRDIDLANRYEVPVVSAVERDGHNFEK